MVTTTPSIDLDSFDPILMGMVKEIFGDFASWRHKKEENDRLREANFKKMAEPGTYEAQLSYLRQRLAEEPIYQTFFVLDPNTGQQKFVTPIVYAESMNGTGTPPIVTADGKVIVKFQALLRSRYEHYSPFLNVGYFDTATGHITPIMDQSRTYGWHDSLLLVHDEQCQLSAAGRVLINTHQDNVNAMDLETLRGYEQPFCRNVHEPKPGEAVGIWATLFRNEPVPVGKEWLARGTAVYGGGSVIDTAVSIAGDSFYYVPTHEINAGVAVIAYRMAPGGKAGQETRTPAAKLTDQEWAKVQELPWDWDTPAVPEAQQCAGGPAGEGRGHGPEPADTGRRPARQPDHGWRAGSVHLADACGTGHCRPGTRRPEGQTHGPGQGVDLTGVAAAGLSAGQASEGGVSHFRRPDGDAVHAGSCVPTMSMRTCKRASGGTWRCRDLASLQGGAGQRAVDPARGAVRSFYDIAPDKLFRLMDDITRCDVARLYPLWLWASVTATGRILRASGAG